jgi:hypothetical protein
MKDGTWKYALEGAITLALVAFPFAVLWFRAATKSQGISRGTVRFSGTIMLPLALVLLGLEEVIDKGVVGALIGTMAGYLLSTEDTAEDKDPKPRKKSSKDDLKDAGGRDSAKKPAEEATAGSERESKNA